MSETTTYYFIISADFSRKLDEPTTEYVPGGYTIKEFETGTGFISDTIKLPADQEITKLGLLNYAIEQLVERQNRNRAAQGRTIMFDRTHVFVKFFDAGRNEL
jgi:hypothetical protein